MRFVSLDDVSWTDKKGKEEINAGELLQEFINYLKNSSFEQETLDRRVISDIGIVKGSDALKMYDSNFIPHFHQVAGKRLPIVFNNACSTWRELAVKFAIGGSSAYIGTSIDIPNPIAKDVASKFVSKMLKGMSIGKAIYESQKDYISDFGYTPYLMHGYIDLKINQYKPRREIHRRFLNMLITELEGWSTYSQNAKIKELRINSEHAVHFLEDELNDYKSSFK